MKKGAKRKHNKKSSKDLFSKRNIIILIIVLVLVYFVVNSGDSNEEDGVYSLRDSIRAFFARLFGLGGCKSNSDCDVGEACDTLTSICAPAENVKSFSGFND